MQLRSGYFRRILWPNTLPSTSEGIQLVPNLGQPVTQTAIRGRRGGRARVESMHKSYMDAYGNKVAEDAVFKSPYVVIIFDEAPRYQEVRSKQ